MKKKKKKTKNIHEQVWSAVSRAHISDKCATAPKRTVKSFYYDYEKPIQFELSSERSSRFSNKNAKALTLSLSRSHFPARLLRLFVHSLAYFHFVALVTCIGTVSGFPESNFSVANTHTETWFFFFPVQLVMKQLLFCFVLFSWKKKELRDWNYLAKWKKDQPTQSKWMNECPLRASDSHSVGIEWLMLHIFFISYDFLLRFTIT